ncbi:435_t:CDS:2, partial [Cetraspora pellucida]
EQVSNMTSSTEQASPTYTKQQERFNDKFTKKDELTNRLIIQIDQKNKQAPKFSIIDNISEIYELPGIHECINEQQPLRAMIDIDASKEKIEAENINTKNEEIIKGLVIMTSSNDSKCSYHLLYTPTLLVDYQKLKEFTELVYRLTEEKYDNGWCNLNDSQVQPPINMNLEVRPCILSVKKINQKKIIVGQDSLKKYANLVLQKYSDYLGRWDIEEKDSQYFIYFNWKAYLECSICKHTHDKDQWWFSRTCYDGLFIVKCFQQNRDERGEIFNDPSIAEKIQQKNNNTPNHPKIKGPKFPKPFLEMLSWVKCESSLTAREVYKKQYIEPLSKEGD